MVANVQTALATKVQDLSGVFRKKQTAYLKRELDMGFSLAGLVYISPLTTFANGVAYRRAERPREPEHVRVNSQLARPARECSLG